MNQPIHSRFSFSQFAKQFSQPSGIKQLMDDIVLASKGDKEMIMLGGGNPANIAAVHQFFSKRISDLVCDVEKYPLAMEKYSTPQGDQELLDALANFFQEKLKLPVKSENIALTCGSQSSFYMLFNLFAGTYTNQLKKKVLFPLSPEYIGYEDSMFEENAMASVEPVMDIDDENRTFKYRLNPEKIHLDETIGLMCVSRPTNPTGNVVTDDELLYLDRLAQKANIPLIIDNAYGAPFPNLLFKKANLIWNENTILCLSLSKLGLPSIRTGIVIANQEIIQLISSMTAQLTLAPPSFGAKIVAPLIMDGSLEKLCEETIKPHYQDISDYASKLLLEELRGYDCFLHENEGAFFLWLWMRNFPITTKELYERLKKEGIIIIPGEYFFPGLPEDFQHKHECIRISFANTKENLRKGLKIIADQVKQAYDASA